MTDQVKYNNKLANQHVLIIGGTSGIGYGVAEAVLENGGRVTVSSSNPTRVKDAVSRLSKAYPSASQRINGYPANLGEEATMEDNIKALFDQCKDLNHVVFTAGNPLADVMVPIQEATFERIKQAGMVRYFAVLLVVKYASKALKASTASSITLTTGSVSQRPLPGWSMVAGYATALHGLTRGLALDLKPLRVNLISPGAVETEMWDHMPAEQRQAMMKQFETGMATGKVGEVQDVAEAYLYAMKDQNLTGTMLSTNGGVLLM